MEPSLYDQIGGAPAVAKMVQAFYDRVLSDPLLSPFFVKTGMPQLRRMQVEFFTTALGGPIGYSGAALGKTHFGRGIERRHFARFSEHLLATLRDIGVPESAADGVVRKIATYAPDIVGESSNTG
jgi:hemoglobin